MRNVEIIGYGYYVPENTVEFDGQIRHRVPKGSSVTQISMAVAAAREALAKASLDITDIDCIVSASAVDHQPIPCTAALIHEQIAKGTDIPAHLARHVEGLEKLSGEHERTVEHDEEQWFLVHHVTLDFIGDAMNFIFNFLLWDERSELFVGNFYDAHNQLVINF